MAVAQGEGTIVDQFAVSSGTLSVVGGAGLVVGSFVSGGTATDVYKRQSLFWLFQVNLGEVKLTPSRYGNEKNRDRNMVSNVVKSKTE